MTYLPHVGKLILRGVVREEGSDGSHAAAAATSSRPRPLLEYGLLAGGLLLTDSGVAGGEEATGGGLGGTVAAAVLTGPAVT